MRESNASWLVATGFERLRISSGTPNTPESRPSTSSAVERELPRSSTSDTGIGWSALEPREANLGEERRERLEQRGELEERLVDAGALEAAHELARLGVIEELRDLGLVERAERAAFVVSAVEVAPAGARLLERVDREHGAHAAAGGLGEEDLHRERAGELVGHGQPSIRQLGRDDRARRSRRRDPHRDSARRTENVEAPRSRSRSRSRARARSRSRSRSRSHHDEARDRVRQGRAATPRRAG